MAFNEKSMIVIKRDGRKESIHFDKITERIKRLCSKEELEKIDISKITLHAINSLSDNISTMEIDNITANICASFSSIHPLYQQLGGRILTSNLHKNLQLKFSEKSKRLYQDKRISIDYYNLVEKHKTILDNNIDYNRDYQFNYFGFKTLEKAYLLRVNNQIMETPQDMYMRVALFIHNDNIQQVLEAYNDYSLGYYTHATPTLFNSGSIRPQLSSCFLLGTNDNLEDIFKLYTSCGLISKWAGGIGVHISNLRCNGSFIDGTGGEATGIVPMCQVLNSIARYVNQGGKRKGSISVYLEPHHGDIIEFLELRKNTGTEDRARDLFTALWISDLFMKQVEIDGDWYLFSEKTAPNLNNVYGDEYEKLYWKYVEENKYVNKLKARYVWNKIMEAQIESGTPYIAYKDNVNNKSNQKNIGTIKSSNLCIEIMEYSDNDEYAVCNLASIALPKIIRPINLINEEIIIHSKKNCIYCHLSEKLLIKYQLKYTKIIHENNNLFDKEITFPRIIINDKLIGGYNDLLNYINLNIDYQLLETIAYRATKGLDKVIDINYYPVKETRKSNLKHRPIGLGVQGLADVYALLKVPFDSNEANDINERIFETIYYGSVRASIDLAKERESLFKSHSLEQLLEMEIDKKYLDRNELIKKYNDEKYRGSYSSFEGSPFSEGKFQFDLWNYQPKYLNWNILKDEIKKYGIKNSLLTALMPTASTSNIMGNNECFEPYTSNIYTRRTLAGEFAIVNQYLIEDLEKLNLWNDKIREEIIRENGSIQHIKEIPDLIKNIYKTSWEIKQKNLIDQAITRGRFIDQSQSMNLFFDKPNFNKLSSSQFYSWKNGLKTGIYYLRSKPARNAVKFTIKENNKECLECSA